MHPTPIKVALMSSLETWGGGEQFLWSLGMGLQARGHSVLWVCSPDSPLYGRVQEVGGECFPLTGRFPTPKAMYELRRRCAERGIEILHANDSHALTWGSVAMIGKQNLKRVGVKHTAFPIRSAVRYNWMLDRLVCVSNAVQNICVDGGVAKVKTRMIHGGIEPKRRNKSEDRFWACEQLGIRRDRPLFCAVGSLIPCKRYELLIEAANILRWKLAEFSIVICGEGKSRASLEHGIRKHGLQSHVHLLGFQADPDRWISAADAFVHPAQIEGLSLVSIQAQMAETLTITTESGGLREVIRSPIDNAPLGLLVDSDDPSHLADRMHQGLENNYERMELVRAAKRSALSRFSLERMLNEFETLYQDLMQDPKRAHPILGRRYSG